MLEDLRPNVDRGSCSPVDDALISDNVVTAAQAIQAGDDRNARTLLEAVLGETEGAVTPAGRLGHIFAAAMLARLEGDSSGLGNLYTNRSGTEDMLTVYQLFLTRTPYARFGHAVSNAALAASLVNASRIHIIDLGIGTGVQWYGFFRMLAGRALAVQSLRITGVDLPAPGPDPRSRLAAVGTRLQQHAVEFGLPFEFTAVPSLIERLDFDALDIRERTATAVNAVLSLHHTPANDGVTHPDQSRDAVLQRICQLNPHIFTFVEVNMEHNALPFVSRVREAWRNFLMIFDAHDSLFRNSPAEREAMEKVFWGREIVNVIAGEGAERTERPECHEEWCNRLHAAELERVSLSHAVDDSPVTEFASQGIPYSVAAQDGFQILKWRGKPLFVASAWRPRYSQAIR